MEPVERRWTSGGWDIQGWLYPAGEGPRPMAVEIHGGPHTLYGWAPILEWQVLAGAGVSVLACNPRGSEGYGEAFNRANLGDWGDGPMADVMAGVDGAVADGLADPDRLGVTGGSYGGYLTNWIVGRTDRFRAAVTCRSVADMGLLFMTGDISGGEWAEIEFGRSPWEDPAYFDSISPISLAANVRTPLLIQHSERDLRCTVGQAEALFTVLRSAQAPGPVHARTGREPRAHPRRDPVPARGEHRPDPGLVRALPGARREAPAAAAQGPGGAVGPWRASVPWRRGSAWPGSRSWPSRARTARSGGRSGWPRLRS